MDRTSFGTFCRFFAYLAVVLTIGCGDSQSPLPTADVPATAGQAEPGTALAPSAGPQETAGHYLEAVRLGDAGTVNGLLTTLAREKTAEMNISVSPPGSDTAHYEVGAVRYVSENQDRAHVDTTWIELDETGVEEAHEITWIMRQELVGWRVAGMMGKFVADQPVMIFDFEDPQEVIRQRDASEERMARQAAERQAPAGQSPETRRQ